MIKHQNLLSAPPTPDFLIDPDNPKSVKQMRDVLQARALWEEVDDCYHIQAERRAGLTKEQYVNSLTADEYNEFVDRAEMRVVTTASQVKGLAGRVSMSAAFDVLRKTSYKNIGEKYDNIREFLEAKLDPDDPHGSSSYEAAFLLELIESFEKMGKGGMADRVFSNKFVYGKLVAQIPALRKKQNALVAAQAMFRDLVGGIEQEQKQLRKAKSEARVRGEPEEVLKTFDEKIEVLEQKKTETTAKSSDTEKKLRADLSSTGFAAFQLAGSNIPRSEVAKELPKAAKVLLQKQGFKPEEVSPDYAEDSAPQKPKAYAVHTDHKVIYVIETDTRQSSLVSKLLSEQWDLGLAELEEAISFLSQHRKKGA